MSDEQRHPADRHGASRRREVVELMERLAALLPGLHAMDESDFRACRDAWLALQEAMKDAVFTPNPTQKRPDRTRFELAQGAQSIQFMVDLLPHLHRRMVRFHDRQEPLSLVDIGAGSGAGTQLLAQLHSDIMIWSRLDITAVDHVPWRQRWVAMHYPRVKYLVSASSELPARSWDFAICSHVIEHLQEPQEMIADVLRACRGFAFIYAPFRENPLSPGHVSVITEETFRAFDPEEIHVLESMGFYGEGRACILAIFDCRDRQV